MMIQTALASYGSLAAGIAGVTTSLYVFVTARTLQFELFSASAALLGMHAYGRVERPTA